MEVVEVGRGPMPARPGFTDALAIVDGMACRSRRLPDGGRLIAALLVPGDLLGWPDRCPDPVAGSVELLSTCRLARIPRDAFATVVGDNAGLAFGLREAVRAEEAALCERLVSLGRRTSRGRLAHLCSELLVRSRAAGRATGDGYDLPVDRRDLADALGLSVLNLGRILRGLGDDGLLRWDGRRMEILDLRRLEAEAGFDRAYLRLGRADEAAAVAEPVRLSA